MGYRIASGLNKDRFPALIARDSTLSADSLRTAIALYREVANSPGGEATEATIAGATGLSSERVRSALAALRATGYIEADAGVTASPVTPASRRPLGGRRPGRGGRLDAAIMDYELDIDGLIRAGDANIRDAGTRALNSRPGAGATGTADRSPLLGEQTQPAAIRFMVWLRFVLGPDELAACDRFALAHKERWKDWIARFTPAKVAGAEDELLDDIRRALRETASPDATPAPPDPGPGLTRPH